MVIKIFLFVKLLWFEVVNIKQRKKNEYMRTNIVKDEIYWYIRMSDFFIEIITFAYNINNEWNDSMDFDVLQTFLPFYKKKKTPKKPALFK